MTAATLVFLIAKDILLGQSVPASIRYHAAPSAVNAKAQTELSNLLTAKEPDLDGLADSVAAKTILCGPSLWHDMQAVAPLDLKNAAPTTFAVPSRVGTQHFEGRRFKTMSEKTDFLKLILARYVKKAAMIRKANRPELSYYWAWAAWDLREPLYVVSAGSRNLMFNFLSEKGTPKIFMVDLVGSTDK